jgi:2-polyprenyl-6-methoxyphenol hydroxylase-like FAD-dependent oxidoreductase
MTCRWCRYRDGMVIVGDAAHAASPASGQGVDGHRDAVTLAKCLRDCDREAAFASYGCGARGGVVGLAAQARKNARPARPQTRDMALRVIFRRMAKRGDLGNGWMQEHRIDWSSRRWSLDGTESSSSAKTESLAGNPGS